MSDGNFNRALLPSTPYRSGMKMGQVQMRGRAIEAFQIILKEAFPTLSEEALTALSEKFKQKLSSPVVK